MRRMKKIPIVIMLLASVMCYGQDKLPDKPKQETPINVTLKEGAYVYKSGTRYSGRTYTEIYEVITDSIVHRFGMEFRSADSTFVRKVPMEGTTRELYDRMNSDVISTVASQERLRKETVEFLNRYRASYEVWLYFKVLGIFGR